jgi:hypothetical protein
VERGGRSTFKRGIIAKGGYLEGMNNEGLRADRAIMLTWSFELHFNRTCLLAASDFPLVLQTFG